jgi:hypothetical protein
MWYYLFKSKEDIMSHSKIINIIRKLLALGKSPNVNEAASAIEKARILMQKYNLLDSDINQTNQTTEDIVEITVDILRSSRDQSLKFAFYLGKAFNVRPIQIKRNVGVEKVVLTDHIKFIGKVADVEFSKHLFIYVMSNVDRYGKDYVKDIKKDKAKIKYDFSLGFISAVCNKLIEIQQENDAKLTPTETDQINALVVCTNALINQYMKEKYEDKLHDANDVKVNVNQNAYADGYAKGEQQGLYRGVEAGKQNQQIRS